MIKLLSIFFLLALSFSSCKELGTNESGSFQVVEFEDITSIEKITFETLQRNVLKPSGCMNCHFWAGSETAMLSSLARVKPGDADNSALFKRVRNGTMPPASFPALNSQQLEIVERYINDLIL